MWDSWDSKSWTLREPKRMAKHPRRLNGMYQLGMIWHSCNENFAPVSQYHSFLPRSLLECAWPKHCKKNNLVKFLCISSFISANVEFGPDPTLRMSQYCCCKIICTGVSDYILLRSCSSVQTEEPLWHLCSQDSLEAFPKSHLPWKQRHCCGNLPN